MVIRSRPVTNREIRMYEGTLGLRRGSLHHDYVFVGRYIELRNGNEQLPSEAIVLKKGHSYIPTRKESILPGAVFGQPLFTHTTATRGEDERVLKSSLLTKYEPEKVEEAKKTFRKELDNVIYSLC